MLLKSFNRNKPLYLILLLGLVIRIFYVLWGADIYLGDKKYIMGDTSGWVNSFLNLLNFGTYSFDLNNPEALFGRVPGFSFFWGIHYLVFGKYAYQAVAASQLILDVISIFLVYRIAKNIYAEQRIALIAAALYAVYPFIIIWITISYSELLTNFFILLILFFVTKEKRSLGAYFLIGLLCAMAFFVREFAGILLPISIVTIFLVEYGPVKVKLLKAGAITIAFLCLYSLWPLRNYINHNRIVLARTMGGFSMYEKDFQSFRTWVNSWDPDETKWLIKLVANNEPIDFPEHIFSSPEEKDMAKNLVDLSRNCGSSFQLWKEHYGVKGNNATHCNDQIATGYDALTSSFIKNNFLIYLTDVPIKNLKKAVFKNEVFNGSMVKSKARLLTSALFTYRSILICLAIFGIVLSFRNLKLFPLAAYAGFMYLFLCFIIRFLEMRNLLQADVVLIIPAAFTIFKVSSFIQTNLLRRSSNIVIQQH